MKLMDLSDSRTARVRSVGEGIPPCRVCPREAERESKSDPPSSLNILVITSVVYTSEETSFLIRRDTVSEVQRSPVKGLPENQTAFALALRVQVVPFLEVLDVVPQHVEVDTAFRCVHDASTGLLTSY